MVMDRPTISPTTVAAKKNLRMQLSESRILPALAGNDSDLRFSQNLNSTQLDLTVMETKNSKVTTIKGYLRKSDIEQGVRCRSIECPLARLLKRLFPNENFICVGLFECFIGRDVFPLTKQARKLILDFDDGHSIKPGKITIAKSKHLLTTTGGNRQKLGGEVTESSVPLKASLVTDEE